MQNGPVWQVLFDNGVDQSKPFSAATRKINETNRSVLVMPTALDIFRDIAELASSFPQPRRTKIERDMRGAVPRQIFGVRCEIESSNCTAASQMKSGRFSSLRV
jgi:hypothetical protein